MVVPARPVIFLDLDDEETKAHGGAKAKETPCEEWTDAQPRDSLSPGLTPTAYVSETLRTPEPTKRTSPPAPPQSAPPSPTVLETAFSEPGEGASVGKKVDPDYWRPLVEMFHPNGVARVCMQSCS